LCKGIRKEGNIQGKKEGKEVHSKKEAPKLDGLEKREKRLLKSWRQGRAVKSKVSLAKGGRQRPWQL